MIIFKIIIKIKEWYRQCKVSLDHHQSSSFCWATLVGYSACFSSPLFWSYYSLLSCSCWLLMVSISLEMKRSTISFHSWPWGSLPLRTKTSRANSQNTIAIALGTLLLQGITTSTKSKGASVLHRAIVGILTYEASTTACLSFFGSATITSLGYWNFLVNWLVRVPGIHLDDELAVHPVYWPNL